MSKRVWEYGDDPSNANVAKIAVNLLIIHALQALAESLTIIEHYGLNSETFIDAINESIFPGAVYTGYGKGIASKTYSPAGFTTTLGMKDLSLALQAADEAGVHLPSGHTLRTIFEISISNGNGDLDWSSIAEVTRTLSSEQPL
jgi:3-hydroxyisobutyrate dehydrogenase-like beta-hydroxyacid dehydrogenase